MRLVSVVVLAWRILRVLDDVTKFLFRGLIIYYSEENKRFFAEAMQEQTVDVVKRMKEISMVMNLPSEVIEAQDITPDDIEGVSCVLLFKRN